APSAPPSERPRGTAPRRAAHRAPPPKKSPVPVLLGGAGLVVVVVLVWLFGLRGEPEKSAKAAEVPSIDLSTLADLTPLDGTSETEWSELNELVKKYTTPPFSPASVPFGDRLMNKQKKSVPAILNGFKRLDLSTQDGAEIGWKVQTMLLQGLCSDVNFGWRKMTRPED